MAQSTIASGNIVTLHKRVRREYVRGGVFGKYIGPDDNKIIQVTNESKKFNIPLIGKLGGPGVRGSTQLTGNESALSNYSVTLQPSYLREGVLIDNEENEKGDFDLAREAEPALKNWIMETKRDQMIQALGAIEAGGTHYNYGGSAASGATGSSAASAANMDTWNTNNGDRILYGAAQSNRTAGDHTTSLGTIDTTADKLTPTVLSLIIRMAENADPLIRPIMINGADEPVYVYFCGSYSFRDLYANSEMTQALREAGPRGLDKNPLFTSGDLFWQGIIIKKVPDMDKFIDSTGSGLWDGVWGANATGDSLKTAGGSSSRVGVGFLCGAQAIGFGIGKAAQIKRRKEDDYEHLNGVGISAKHDIKKLFYNNKQHGVLTHFHSAAVDS